MILSKDFFSKQQNKVLKLLNSRIWKPLKSSVVIFQALETSSSSWTSAAFAASAASTASKGQSSQEKVWSWLSDHHWHQNNQYWSFFVEWIAKNPIFHWYMALFLTEAVEAVWGQKVSNDGSSINFHYSGSHWASVFGRFVKTSGQARSLLCVNS